MKNIQQENLRTSFLNNLSDLHLLDLFDSLPDVQFWIKNIDGLYMKVNSGFLKNYMMTNENQIIGRSDMDLAPAYLVEQWIRDDKKVLEGAYIKNRVELVGEFNHNISWHMTNKMPLYSKIGKIIGTSGTTRRIQDGHLISGDYKELEIILRYINTHYSSSIKNEDLAGMIHLSKSAFERKFKKMFKDSPQQYIKKIRINNACKRLISSNDSIVTIAMDCGLCDQSYITKEFKLFLGKTPYEIRKGL